MIVTDVTKFHKRYLGGQGMLEHVCVWILRGGNSKVRS